MLHSQVQEESLYLAAAAAKSLQLCPTLCDPIDESPPGSSVPGILQARTLEWVAISFSNAWKWKVKVKVKLCPTLSDPMDCSLQGSSIHGISQASVLEWGAIAFSEEISSLSHSVIFLDFFALMAEEGFLISSCYSLELCIRCLYLSFSPFLFTSLLFTAICKASPDSHFAFLHFFSIGMLLIPVSCIRSQTSVHSSSGTLSDLVP